MPFDDDSITVRRSDDNEWTVVGDLVYHGKVDTFVVPDGFPTDFATVPRVVVWLIRGSVGTPSRRSCTTGCAPSASRRAR